MEELIKQIVNLVLTIPNDQTLGEEIRKLIMGKINNHKN